MSSLALSRRAWLVKNGLLAGGITAISACGIPPLPSFGAPKPADALLWLRLAPDGTLQFFCPRAEMGQGIVTGLRQIVAEELGVAVNSIECRLPRTDQITAPPMTVGSQSMELFFRPTAEVASALRTELQKRLALQEGLAFDDITPRAAAFELPDGRRFRYRDLVAPSERTVLAAEIVTTPYTADETRLRSIDPVHAKRVIGQDNTPWDSTDMVTGRSTYSRDVRLPYTLFGAVLRPPELAATLRGFNTEASLPPGVRLLLGPAQGLVGIVAPTPHAAQAALALLEPDWQRDAAPEDPFTIEHSIEHDEFDHRLRNQGDIATGSRAAQHALSLDYATAMTAHAAMEPRAASARRTHDVLEVWTACQDPWFVQAAVARLVNLPKNQVVVHNQRIGGAFGGRVLCQAALEAAWLANTSRRAVKVQWSREDEFAYNYFGPATAHRIDCGITAGGEISHWHHRTLSAPILTTSALVPSALHWLADLPADPGTARGLLGPYRIPHERIELADRRIDRATGPWRGLGAAHNTFAVESAIDELAVAAQLDTLTLRMQHLQDPALRNVVEILAERCRWHDSRPPGTAVGMACCTYKDVTHVAVAAEFITPPGGEAYLSKLWCVHDCGLLVHPDRVRAQIEGNLVWGVSMARHERVQPDSLPGNFDEYNIARHTDIPELNIYLHESDREPVGAGEAAFAPTPAAIANAFARVGGERPRMLPFLFHTQEQSPADEHSRSDSEAGAQT